MRHRPFTLSALLGMALLQAACAQPKPLTILHVNDIHTHFLPETAEWSKEDPKPLTGGMVALQDAVAREKAPQAASTLVLDAGDWLTGTPLSEVVEEGIMGGAFMAMMNKVGFDASTIGNHDFDNGVEALHGLVDLATFPVLSANLRQHDQLVADAPWMIFDKGGVKVGVVGLILDDLAKEISKETMDGFSVQPVAATARQAIAELDPQTDVILLLTHQGWKEDSLLATKVEGADLIIGGHSHSRLKTPRVVNGVIIAQAGSYARDLGRIDLLVENDRVLSHKGGLVSLFERDVKSPDEELVTQVAEHKARIDEVYARVIGDAPARLGRDYFHESPLGDWMCDALRGLTGAHVAVLNSGGLRTDLDAGPVTRLDIKQILPFQNTVVLVECSGEELRTLLRTNAEAGLRESQGVLQISGASCRFRDTPNGAELTEALVDGRPIDPAARYQLATVDYVLGLAEKYMGFTPATHESRGGTLFQAMCDWIEAHPQVTVPTGGRQVREN